MITTATPEALVPALHQLRITFPQWGFLYNPFARRWHGVRAHHPTITTYSPEELARQVGAYQALPPQPAAGIRQRVSA